jgi:phosphate-selective porin OprO/OprP
MGANVDTPDGSDPSFSGYYAYASYFLTGEHRAYKNSSGTFDRVKPKTNFGKGGTGAWEVALRYSGLDLNDAPIQGGELEDITFGLNWYLNPNVRAMFNYVLADLDTVGNADIVQLRFQIDF